MKNFLKLFLLVYLLFAFSAAIAEIIVTQFDKPIRVNQKSPPVIIQLEANPSTGYQWSVSRYDAEYIQSIKYQYLHPKVQPMGVPGLAQFEITLSPRSFLRPRQIQLNFIYHRPWEKVPVQSKRVIIMTQ